MTKRIGSLLKITSKVFVSIVCIFFLGFVQALDLSDDIKVIIITMIFCFAGYIVIKYFEDANEFIY